MLFTKWDRFSRNAGDAYQMINVLRKLGVEPQAIEQPLDLSIPESKMMLAFYLAAPEVENDRRALNVFYGMRRARKEGRFVKGQHDPIISESLFYEVQDVLDGRGRHYRLKTVAAVSLPLRGYLLCPECGKVLSGSASRGRDKYYAYYHCFDGCTHRFRADHVNDLLTAELKKYTPCPKWEPLFKRFLSKSYHQQTGRNQEDGKQLTAQIKDLEGKLSKARDLLLSDQIDPADYRCIKAEY